VNVVVTTAWLPLALLVAACGAQVPGPTAVAPAATAASAAPAPIVQRPIVNPCEFGAVVFDVGPVKLCEKAVALATQQLAVGHGPITSITFRQVLCPAGQPCPAPRENEAWIVFTIAGGAVTMVHIAPAGAGFGLDGPLVADPPQVPPAWLVAEVLGNLAR
jgi:hypothetical protein